jgi:hypothetical protein
MKKLSFLIAVVAVPVILLLMSYHAGSPGGRSGSPGDNGNTCTGCHTGTANTAFAWITTNVPTSGYVAGQTYTITATGTHQGVVRFGFELTVEDSQGNKVGTLQITDPTRTKLVNGNKAVTHTASGITPAGNSNSWSVDWVAPTGVQGNIGIYSAFNAANGNGSTSGDVIYKSSTFIAPYVPPPPALVSIIPSEANQGESLQVTITGSNTNFTGSPAVSLVNSLLPLESINASGVTVISSTVLQAQFNIPALASPGLWDLWVDNLVLTESFTVNLISGTADPIAARTNVYPNPATDRIFIDNARGSEIRIFNLSGQILRSDIASTDKQIIDISNLQGGVYFVRISNDNAVVTEKLLVN